MRVFRIAATFFVAGAVALPLAATAQSAPPSLAGTWTLDAEVTIEGEQEPCIFQGTATLTQDGAQVSGPVTLSLLGGPSTCVAELTGTLTGSVEQGNLGILVSGTIDGGKPQGEALFNGAFSSPMVGITSPKALLAMAWAMQASSGNGSISVQSGPFAGAGGTWSASAPAAPTLAPLGLTILVALLLLAGFVALRRQGMQPA